MQAYSPTFFESQRKTDKRFFRVGAWSLAVHVVVIGAAVYATHGVLTADNSVHADTTMVLLSQTQPKPPEPQALDVAVKGFQTIVVPTLVPTSIPVVNLSEHFDPADYSGRGVEGGTATGEPLANQLYSEALVEEKPILLSAPPLNYPEMQRREGIEGHVVIEAIVDTTGRVEPSSIKILMSSNPAFDLPTRQWVLKALFRPARLHGGPVRVLISQPVDYTFTGRTRG